MIPSQINVHVVNDGKRKFLQLRWTDPDTGQLRKRTAKTTSRREAERHAAKLEKELRAGCAPDAITWEKFRERHETEARSGRAVNTCEKYDTALDHVERILKPRYLRDLTPGRLSEFVKVFSTEESKRTGKVRSPQTVGIVCRHLKAALRWAHDMGLLSYMPKIKPPKVATDDAKGRPLTGEELDRMVAVAARERPGDANAWQHFLRGLWWSGLRIGEAFQLSWDSGPIQAELGDDGRAVLRFKAEAQKGRRGELWPCAPEFAIFLAETPKAERAGRVFKLDVPNSEAASRVVSSIGAKANVVTGEDKTASAHDLRRSFGTRWSKHVMPAVLQRLMRHKSIQTTLTYYVWHNANEIADELWKAYDAGKSPIPSPTNENQAESVDVSP